MPDYQQQTGTNPRTGAPIYSDAHYKKKRAGSATRSKSRSQGTPRDEMKMDPTNMPTTHYDKRSK